MQHDVLLERHVTGWYLAQYLRRSCIQVIWVNELRNPAESDMGVIYLRTDLFDPRPHGRLLGEVAAGRVPWQDAKDSIEQFAAAQCVIAHEILHHVMGDVNVAQPMEGSEYRERAEQRAHQVELKVVCELCALLTRRPVDYGYQPAWETYGDILPADPYDVRAMLTGTDPDDPEVARVVLTLPRPQAE